MSGDPFDDGIDPGYWDSIEGEAPRPNGNGRDVDPEEEIPLDDGLVQDGGAASPCADVANAHRLVEHFGDDLRWAPELSWNAWSGKRWERSESRAQGFAMRLGRIVQAEAAELEAQAAGIADVKKREEVET